MLRALLESGVEPDMVIGSSVGSINGAYFAGDPTLDGIAKLERLWCSLKRRDIFPWTWRRLIGFIRGRGHLVTSRPKASARQPSSLSRPEGRGRSGAHRRLRRSLGQSCGAFARPGDASHPRQHGDPGRLRAGRDRRAAAVRRSRRQQYVGDAAISLGARRLIVLPTGFACAPERPPSGAIASALHAITLLTASQLVAELERIKQPTQYHILPTACPLGVWPFDFARTQELIDQAYQRTLSWISVGGLDSHVIPDALRPHSHTAPTASRPVLARTEGGRSGRSAPVSPFNRTAAAPSLKLAV
jgi:NTE family protein